MAARLPRRRTGDRALDQRLLELLDDRSLAPEDRDLIFEMLTTVLRMAGDDIDRLSLKIVNAALREMRQAFRVFAPYRDVPKITIFGSARTLPDDPLYVQARDLAAAVARAGWMVVTGAGPGIMAAGAEGAGRARSIGVNIRLPFEQDANPFIAADPKLVSMKYFFTRKLMLMKESAGFVVLPGGFGTLDETFELLTLLQTGKAAPAPLLLLEVPGGTYWKAWERFLRDELAERGLVDPDDLKLYRITSDVDEAAGEILGFYRNYHSLRYVGPTLVIRLRGRPTEDEVAALNRDFAAICVEGGIEATGPLPSEVVDRDHLDLPRLRLRFDRMSHGRLRALIDTLNGLDSAPPLALPDRGAAWAAGTPPDTGEEAADDTDEVAPDPALAELLARAASADSAAAVEAAEGLRTVLAAGGLSGAQEQAVVEELAALVLVGHAAVRPALLDALAAASPYVGLELVLELLLDHRAQMGRDEQALAALLRTLGTMLDAAAAAAGDGRSHVAVLLRITNPRPALDALAASRNGPVAEQADAVRRRVDDLVNG